ncbi:MAG: aldehyde dehydrogenase [Chloroflexi bacterium]|nr:aldehyde dehydrogenase [Chloroflexota bacterium]
MNDHALDRRWVVRTLLESRDGLLVVTGLGASTYDVAAAGDHPLNFYLWGAMGDAVMVAAGLALARPQQTVLVITGDGEMLMGIGGLATLAVQRPANLRIVVLDNERFGETGNQATHTAHGLDLVTVAQSMGISDVARATTKAEVGVLAERVRASGGPLFAVVKISDAPVPMVLPPRDGALLKHRFRQALLGPSVLMQ